MSSIASFLRLKAAKLQKPLKEYGLHTFLNTERLSTNTADVVAVHGLDGHYAKSWTDGSTGVNWLTDLMPAGFFVLSFSYNSSVKFSKATCDLYDFADQLLEGLYASRQSEEEKQRPIIFVCHSFGGIVFKQAYVRAHEVERYHELAKSTRGVLFFGTPHRGSGLASWGTMLSSILKTASLGTSTNTQLSRDLEPNSRDLDRISQSFKMKSSGLKIYSFYETEKMDFMNNVERNPDPVLGTCTWILQNPQYRDWLRSEECFLLWVSADPGCGKSVLASYLINNRMGKEGLSEDNLCYFFFKSDNYDQRSGSTALQSLLRQLCTKHLEIIPLVADLLRGQSLEDLKTLWLTLVAAIQKIQVVDEKAHQQVFCVLDGVDEGDDARKLVSLISETFTSSTGIQSMPGDSTSNGLLKLLVLSRPDNFIKNGFDRQPSSTSYGNTKRTAMIRLRGEDQIDSINADISRVVDVTISGLVQDGLPGDFLDDVKDQLIRRADRTFLWVTLIIQLLAAKADTGASPRDLDEILKSRDIDTIYSEMLASRSKEPRARKMLGIILAAARPLTISEMSIALAITPDHNPFEVSRRPLRPDGKTFMDLEYDLVRPFETHVKSICGNFVRIIHNKVYLIHETAREFLLELSDSDQNDCEPFTSPPEVEDPFDNWYCDIGEPQPLEAVPTRPSATVGPWQHSFSIPTCEALLLHICTTFLYMLGKKCTSAELQHPSNSTKDFLEYASMFWHQHFGAIQDMIAPRDLRYYENLCHPMFPGFTTWTTVLCGEVRVKQAAIGRSVDELQDYYIELLGIQLPCHSSDNVNTEFEDSRFDVDRRDKDRLVGRFSSNPATLSNYYFPTAANETGFVSLQHGRRKRALKRGHKKF
ncbi:P-loop containing nucleoside triphosphate hydrolase [Fusarium oxysporum f. sp. vasinfectum]|nr:P-loop containing nucleoside triphosphate hydrolase [Fusarium oxysporum f. sp. vasinfectum]